MRTKQRATQIVKVRKTYASLQQRIQTELELDTLEYNTLVYNVGMNFIKVTYPDTDPEFLKIARQLERSKSFWRWWQHEWNDYQNTLFSNAKTIPQKLYLRIMSETHIQSKTEHSFYTNYLKNFKHELQI